MDFTEICDSLAEQWPPWSERIRMLEFRESLAARPVDNDGRNILYNERLLRYVTPEDCRYYIARELLHLQLNHFGRRGDRDARLWKNYPATLCSKFPPLALKKSRVKICSNP